MSVPHYDMVPMTTENSPIAVTYCGTCGLPIEFCKYGPFWESHLNDGSPGSHIAPVLAERTTPKPTNSVGEIIVKIAPRVGRRYLTTIIGLENFGVDVGKASKVFAKKFACGVGNKDGDVEIQGDFEETIVETITSNWKHIKSKQIVIKRKDR